MKDKTTTLLHNTFGKNLRIVKSNDENVLVKNLYPLFSFLFENFQN